ncbi:MAG: T9SS type A sorting domain-containing protein [Janthinobacterium lividum]
MMLFFTAATFPNLTARRSALGLLALLLLLLAAPLARAQAPAWQEVLAPGGTGYSEVLATTTDAAGNVFIAGRFRGGITFGSTQLTSITPESDLFVAKRSAATGQFVWAQRAGGEGYDYVSGLAVRGNEVYLTGTFSSSGIRFGNTTLLNPYFSIFLDSYSGFVAKLTDAGTSSSFAWAVNFGGIGGAAGTGVAVNGSSLYVTGTFGNPNATFGPITLQNAVARGSTDVFLAKLTEAGSTASFVWATRMGGTDADESTALVCNGSTIYLAGEFKSPTATFGSTTLNISNPYGLYPGDAFVARLSDLGTAPRYDWVVQNTGAGESRALSLATGPGGVYVAGWFNSSVVRFGSVTVPRLGAVDGFVGKIVDSGTAGTLAWVKALGGALSDFASAVAVQGNSVYVGGFFEGPATFGSTTATSQGTGTLRRGDAYVAKLLDSGPTAQVQWALTAGGTSSDIVNALAVVGTQVYAAGRVVPVATFGIRTISGPTGGGEVSFLASFTDAVGLATAPATGPLAGSAVYPNPAHAMATVQLPTVPGAAQATLTLRDALGRAVRTATVPLPAAGQRHELSLAGLPAGFYALQVQAGEARTTHRLVVE